MKKEIKPGKKFYKLKVLHFLHTIKKQRFWLCLCDCGKKHSIRSAALGKTKSCGCLISKKARKHGMHNHPFYRKYRGILYRCYNKKHNNYKNYGARGIKCCWRTFEEFRDDMFKSYEKHVKEFGRKNTTLERIDNDGNYCKENCRWATLKEQANNKKTNRLVTFNGRSQSISMWSKELGFTTDVLYQRIKRRLPMEKCFSKIVQRKKK